jgi:hypothetical protein
MKNIIRKLDHQICNRSYDQIEKQIDIHFLNQVWYKIHNQVNDQIDLQINDLIYDAIEEVEL